MIVEFRLLPPDDGPHRVTRAAFFFAVNKLLKANGGEWQGYLEDLPQVLELPMITEQAALHRLRWHAHEHGIKMQYVNAARSMVRLTTGGSRP